MRQIPERLLAVMVMLAFAVGCSRDPSSLVEKTLDAREQTLRAKDVDAYARLFHPDYKLDPAGTGPLRERVQRRFEAHDAIMLQTFNRRITFEEDGRIARVVQEFRLMATKNGKSFSTSGTEQFLLARHRGFTGAEYLFVEGLGI